MEQPVTIPSHNEAPDAAAALDALPGRVETLQRAVGTVIVGQKATVNAMLYALLNRGHCLLVGVPGLGKTLLVNAFARLLGLSFGRIQFTPDLMPSDITGTVILEEEVKGGHRAFVFAPGPIFTNVLLADEINRTPPKTQAALLEAMQERTVTIAGTGHALQEPFLVLATRNPIEQEGTYPLPEAQLDRFLLELPIEYPSLEDERRIVMQHSFTPTEKLQPLLERAEVMALRDAVARIPAPPNVIDYAVRLVRATRPQEGPEYVRRWLQWGASPRASQSLILAARARAACLGRFNVSGEDVQALANLVLRHRLIRTFQAEADGKSTDDIVRQLLDDIRP